MNKLLIALGGALMFSTPVMAHGGGGGAGHTHHSHNPHRSHNHCHYHARKGFSHCHRHTHRNGNGHHGTQRMHPIHGHYYHGPVQPWQIYLDF